MGSPVLTYHSLDASGSVISLRPEVFRAQMKALAGSGLRVARLGELVHGRRGAAVTFDDGYQNFADEALPVLLEFRIPATVFVVSGMCGKSSDWKAAKGIPRLPLMDWTTLRDLPPDLITLGSHTVSHPDLTKLPPAAVLKELKASRSEIEQRTGRRVKEFAYPYGRSNRIIRAAASQEYDYAVTTRLDYAATRTDPWNLPRLDVYYFRDLQRFASMLRGSEARYVAIRRWLRTLRSWND